MKCVLKNIFIAGMLFFCVFSVAGQEKKTVQTAVIKTMIYCDHCKACETCGQKFNQTLLREKGVQMVVLNEKEMTIKVTFNTKKTNLGTIKQAIARLGYDADEVKADVAAYEKLDGCCKKA
jgi:periplasmic mercuric ion binding protein